MNEMNKLIKLLVKADIPFEVRPFPSALQGYGDTLQILSPTLENCKIDAVSHQGSYGGTNGMIEIMSETEIDVVGWLTAEEAVEYFRKALA